MRSRPLIAYLVLVTLISGGFVIGMKTMGKSGFYLAGPYMLGPAIAAIITRLFFYPERFADAHLRFGRWQHYLRFWGISLGVVLLSFLVYTLLGSISWDLSGDTFLAQLKEQMALSGKQIDDLPAGLSPRMMLVIFFIGGLTVFNVPMIIAGFGEEFGWRGFMFPQLCRSRLVVGFVVGGLIWFAWHIPLVLITPATADFSAWQHVGNGIVLAIGSICTFVFFAYVYAKSRTIWVVSLAHAAFNNGARSLSYFARVENQLLANLGLTVTMLAVVAVLYFRKDLEVFKGFLSEQDPTGIRLTRPEVHRRPVLPPRS
jgi:membrane protease YdiL (CAAX protease family)